MGVKKRGLTALSIVLALALAVAACARATPTPIPTGPPHLLEAMEKMPAHFNDDSIWFVDLRRAREMAGTSKLRDIDEFLSLDEEQQQVHLEALEGLARGANFSQRLRDYFVKMDEAFGFNLFQADVTISPEGSNESSSAPVPPEYVEGEFDAATVRQRLANLGYEELHAAGHTYYAIREDYDMDLKSPVYWTLHVMNRVYVDEHTIVTAPATGLIEAVLETVAGNNPSLAEDPILSSLAASLGDPLSAVIVPRSLALDTNRLGTYHRPFSEPPQYKTQETWSMLHEWEAVGAGYGREEDGSQWLTISLFYEDSDAGEADADELMHRMQTYESAIWWEDLERLDWPSRVFQDCASFSPQHARLEYGSTLAVTCMFGEEESLRNWWLMVDTRDLGFLVPWGID